MPRPLTEISDALVFQAAAGDGRAVDTIVRALQRPIYNVALRMLVDRQDAEDATQESLIRIVTRLAQFRADARFSTWAWRIAVRRILDFRDQRAAGARYDLAGFEADLAEGLDAQAEERAEDAVLLKQLKVACSRALLQCLDGEHRIAFILGEILELDSTEAAEVLEIEPATFRKRLSRARASITHFLTRTCGVMSPEGWCACHRRLDRALALGRLDRGDLEVQDGDLVQIRAQILELSEVQRTGAYFRKDGNIDSKRDFVAAIRAVLGGLPPT